MNDVGIYGISPDAGAMQVYDELSLCIKEAYAMASVAVGDEFSSWDDDIRSAHQYGIVRNIARIDALSSRYRELVLDSSPEPHAAHEDSH